MVQVRVKLHPNLHPYTVLHTRSMHWLEYSGRNALTIDGNLFPRPKIATRLKHSEQEILDR
jgi:hypothetical protein